MIRSLVRIEVKIKTNSCVNDEFVHRELPTVALAHSGNSHNVYRCSSNHLLSASWPLVRIEDKIKTSFNDCQVQGNLVHRTPRKLVHIESVQWGEKSQGV
jgi:hypothetical protein